MTYTNELNKEIVFKTSRSSGPGGQNVNKVESKVELYWHVTSSAVLSDEERLLVLEKLAGRINNAGELVMSSQTERSQLRNKELVLVRFYALLNAALIRPKKRKPTKPSRASVQKRIDKKKKTALNKKFRQKPDF